MGISPWVREHYKYIKEGGLVLDLACGNGRHGKFLMENGFKVVFLDLDISRLTGISNKAAIQIIQHNLEDGSSWPFAPEMFDAVVVTNYLHRPIFNKLISLISCDGLLIYETFAKGNEVFGKPSNPDFLLNSEELIELVRPKMRVTSFYEGYSNEGRKAIMQKIVAKKVGDR